MEGSTSVTLTARTFPRPAPPFRVSPRLDPILGFAAKVRWFGVGGAADCDNPFECWGKAAGEVVERGCPPELALRILLLSP